MLSEVFDAVSISVVSPDGHMTVIFAEEQGKPKRVEIYIGKAGTTLRAWATSFAECVTLGLENGVNLNEYCNVLYGQSSDKTALDTSGLTVTSGPEAFALAILKYNQYKQTQPEYKNDKQGFFRNPTRKNLDRGSS